MEHREALVAKLVDSIYEQAGGNVTEAFRMRDEVLAVVGAEAYRELWIEAFDRFEARGEA